LRGTKQSPTYRAAMQTLHASLRGTKQSPTYRAAMQTLHASLRAIAWTTEP